MSLAYPLPVDLALRYLFGRKRLGASGVTTLVATCGVALATAALLVTLSVFNGFQDLVAGLYSAFDPELRIIPARGKTLDPRSPELLQARALPGIALWSATIEEGALVRYRDRQAMVTIKGVDDQWRRLASVDSLLLGQGSWKLHEGEQDYGVMGIGLVSVLGTGLQPVAPLRIYAPRRGVRINVANPSAAFTDGSLRSPGVVFAVGQQQYDDHYILAPLSFARRLFGLEQEVSAIEVRLTEGARLSAVRRQLQGLLGADYVVQDRADQQADVRRIVRTEKLVSYAFLTFILLIAGFNLIGALTMLVLDKQADAQTLAILGADRRLVRRTFLTLGRMVAILGALAGIVLGLALCLAQQQWGLVGLGTRGQMLVDAYPVSVHVGDVLLTLATAVVVGLLAVWWTFYERRVMREE